MTKLVPFIGEEFLVREKDASGKSLDNAFDELEALIADEFEALEDWQDDLEMFEDSTDTATSESNDFSNEMQELASLQPAKATTSSTDTSTSSAPYKLETIDGGDGLLLRLNGQIDFRCRDQIYHFIRDVRQGSTKHYDLDLGRCPTISVTGISLLLLLKEATAERKVEITLSNCQPKVYKSLHWAGMDKHFLVAPI